MTPKLVSLAHTTRAVAEDLFRVVVGFFGTRREKEDDDDETFLSSAFITL